LDGRRLGGKKKKGQGKSFLMKLGRQAVSAKKIRECKKKGGLEVKKKPQGGVGLGTKWGK